MLQAAETQVSTYFSLQLSCITDDTSPALLIPLLRYIKLSLLTQQLSGCGVPQCQHSYARCSPFLMLGFGNRQ